MRREIDRKEIRESKMGMPPRREIDIGEYLRLSWKWRRFILMESAPNPAIVLTALQSTTGRWHECSAQEITMWVQLTQCVHFWCLFHQTAKSTSLVSGNLTTSEWIKKHWNGWYQMVVTIMHECCIYVPFFRISSSQNDPAKEWTHLDSTFAMAWSRPAIQCGGEDWQKVMRVQVYPSSQTWRWRRWQAAKKKKPPMVVIPRGQISSISGEPPN